MKGTFVLNGINIYLINKIEMTLLFISRD